VSVQTTSIGENGAVSIKDDKVSFTLSFANGSFGTVHYLANGHKSFPKERLEVFCGGKILQLDNFRKLQGYGFSNFKNMNLWNQDKGQNVCAAAFVKAVETDRGQLIPWSELLEVSQISIDVAEAAN
jgi:predicted dehydrogenase